MIVLTYKGNLKKTSDFLENAKKFNPKTILERYAQQGVQALMSATPTDSGKTANSWGYEIAIASDNYSITWTNSNLVDGVPLVILLHYGHGTRNGGYVEGRDFINPALQPIFDSLADAAWKEITRL